MMQPLSQGKIHENSVFSTWRLLVDYQKRLAGLRQQMAQASIDVVFLPISADLQYLTGIPRDMPIYGAVLYPGRWMEGAFIGQTVGPVITLPRMTAEFHLQGAVSGDVRVIKDQDDPFAIARDVLKLFNPGAKPRIALGNDARAETSVALQGLYPGAIFSNAGDLIRPLRRIKSQEEIDALRHAGSITEAAFKDVLPKLHHGMTELEIMSEVDFQLRKHGAIGPSFVTAMYNRGPNYQPGLGHANKMRNTPLMPPVSLLFDFGAAEDGFCYDYGRTVFFGTPNAEAQKIYDTIMSSQAAGIRALKAGAVTCQDVDRAARKVVVDAGFGPNFRHRLGHGIGMEGAR